MTNERVTDAFLEAELYAIRGHNSLDRRTLPATTLRKMLKELIERRAEECSDKPQSPTVVPTSQGATEYVLESVTERGSEVEVVLVQSRNLRE